MAFEKYKGFQLMQQNINNIEEFKKMFSFNLSNYAGVWYDQTRATLNTIQKLKDVLLKAFNCCQQTQKEQMAFWNTMTFDHTQNQIEQYAYYMQTLTKCWYCLKKRY